MQSTLLRRLAAGLALAAAIFAVAPPLAAQGGRMVIDLANPNANPLPIAVSRFAGSGEAANFGRDIARVIAANLERSGLFQPTPESGFPQGPDAIGASPAFEAWAKTGAVALVSGTAQVQGDGRLRIEFRLWDVFGKQQSTGLQYFTPPQNWRRIAHIISDAIYKRVTGEEGYFDTRVVYVAETGPGNRREKRLAIMDQDGANHRFLSSGRLPNGQPELVLTPRFSPSTQEITYLAYVNDQPRVYLFNIETGRREVVGDFPGMTFAPRFSPDGNRVIMSMARGGNTDIWTMDLRSRRQSRLTEHPAIDTSPSYSPDGTQIVFNSDRGGAQQLYVMDSGGGNVRAITRAPGRYGTPVWSPRGDLIAFTKQAGGRFQIGVLRPDGTGERILAESYLDEAPTWSPNGRVLLFFRQSPANSQGVASARLVSIDLTGRNERVVSTPTDASDPAWSPLNQ